MSTSIAFALLPTIVWCLIWLWVRDSEVSLRWLFGGIGVGALLGAPVWFAESAIDGLANPNDRFSRDFVQQVLGAAGCEETLKFVAIGLLLWLAGSSLGHVPRQVVAISIAVAIGFMTLENLVGVLRSETPMSLAMDRQITIFAGHPSYQVIMGYLLAVSLQRRRLGWACAALIVPVALHGWGDLSEQLFKDETNRGSLEDTVLYFAWLASIVVTASSAFFLLWCLRRREA